MDFSLVGIRHMWNSYQIGINDRTNKEAVGLRCFLITYTNYALPTGNLDSKSGQIVIDALDRINRQYRKTVVMVTHDPQMASFCSRILLLKDGVILDELRRNGEQKEFYREILRQMGKL